MIKYIILPGWIRSKSDRQLHFITHDMLIHLYGLNRDECIIINNIYLLTLSNKYKHLPILEPRYNGDYKSHLEQINKLIEIGKRNESNPRSY